MGRLRGELPPWLASCWHQQCDFGALGYAIETSKTYVLLLKMIQRPQHRNAALIWALVGDGGLPSLLRAVLGVRVLHHLLLTRPVGGTPSPVSIHLPRTASTSTGGQSGDAVGGHWVLLSELGILP